MQGNETMQTNPEPQRIPQFVNWMRASRVSCISGASCIEVNRRCTEKHTQHIYVLRLLVKNCLPRRKEHSSEIMSVFFFLPFFFLTIFLLGKAPVHSINADFPKCVSPSLTVLNVSQLKDRFANIKT